MNYAELARQGDPKAIAYLINRNLQSKGIAASKVEIMAGKLLIELQASEPIEDTIMQHVRNGAAKLNIATVKQIEVLQKQKLNHAPTIVEPQKAAAAQPRSHFLEAVLQEIKKPERRRTLILAGGLMATLLLAFNPFSNVKQTSSVTPSVAQSARGGCQSAGSRIWSGVKLYSDSGCDTLAGFVMSSKSGAQTLKIALLGGGEAWYSRDEVKQLYVKGDDPAIDRRQLIIEN